VAFAIGTENVQFKTHLMAIKIMTGNHKGGAAKTQTSLEMAYWLAKRGKRVLFIDIDPQANATKILSENNHSEKRSLPDILIKGDTIHISNRIIDAGGNRIDYVASSLKAGRLETKLPDDSPKEYVLNDALADIEEDYDYILFDTPPSAELIVINALIASDHILLTCNAAMFGSDGVDKLMPIIERIQSHPRMNPNLKVLGILVTIFEGTNDNHKTLSYLQNKYGELVKGR